MKTLFPPHHSDSARHPHLLLDTLLQRLALKNDAQLCRLLELAPPRISKVRQRRAPISDSIVLRIHETCEIPIAELMALVRADKLLHAARPPARERSQARL